MILLDTNVLVGLADERDRHHRLAASDLLRVGRASVYVAGPVLSEAMYFLPTPFVRRRLRDLLNDMSANVAPTDGLEFWHAAMDWCEKYADHDPDWADACLAVLSGNEPRFKVWTYDSEFRTTWRRPDGTRIPLAVR
jgi:predicted nucleic acid-binding protein